jgi:hypothetical protein
VVLCTWSLGGDVWVFWRDRRQGGWLYGVSAGGAARDGCGLSVGWGWFVG